MRGVQKLVGTQAAGNRARLRAGPRCGRLPRTGLNRASPEPSHNCIRPPAQTFVRPARLMLTQLVCEEPFTALPDVRYYSRLAN